MKFSLLPEEEQSRLLKEVWNAGQEYLAMFGLDEHEKEEILPHKATLMDLRALCSAK